MDASNPYDFDALHVLLDTTVTDSSEEEDLNAEENKTEKHLGAEIEARTVDVSNGTKGVVLPLSSSSNTTTEATVPIADDDDIGGDKYSADAKDTTCAANEEDDHKDPSLLEIDFISPSNEEILSPTPMMKHMETKTLNVVALISGGKDSMYNCMHCVSRGHRIIALANISPSTDIHSLDDKKDLSSFMYQTVGHNVISAIADCMELPLIRMHTKCKTKSDSLEYTRTEGDEVEDMYNLLAEVKDRFPTVDAVSVGAVFSNYQRNRVENVCSRLGLTPLCFLWRRNQRRLLKDMIDCHVDAVLVKVACLGLSKDDVGKSLASMESKLLELNTKFHVHPCGEGGEYETLTLDCPLFPRRRIVLDKTRKIEHSDDGVAPVVSLVVDEYHLESKENPINLQSPESLRNVLPYEDFLQMGVTVGKSDAVRHRLKQRASYSRVAMEDGAKFDDAHSRSNITRSSASHKSNDSSEGSFVQIAAFSTPSPRSSPQGEESVRAEMSRLMRELKAKLKARGVCLADVLHVRLNVRSMSDFAKVNEAFCEAFGGDEASVVPSRSCVQVASEPSNQGRISLSCVARRGSGKRLGADRRMLWVRSISSWAPTNIGPYCQANTCLYDADEDGDTGGISFLAGQIGLEPASMKLVRGGWGSELVQSIDNCRAVLSAIYETQPYTVTHCLLFVSWKQCRLSADGEAASRERITISSGMKRLVSSFLASSKEAGIVDAVPVLIVGVPRLPRDASVELELVAATKREALRSSNEDAALFGSCSRYRSLNAHAVLTSLSDDNAVGVDDALFRESLLPLVIEAFHCAKMSAKTASTHITVYYVPFARGDSEADEVGGGGRPLWISPFRISFLRSFWT
eukprot:g509.t1